MEGWMDGRRVDGGWREGDQSLMSALQIRTSGSDIAKRLHKASVIKQVQS